MGLFDFLTLTIGIDPGSQNLRITEKEGICFNETTQLSVSNSGIINGIGKSMQSSENNRIIQPINYAITDFTAFEELLKKAIPLGLNQKSIFKSSLKTYQHHLMLVKLN